MGKLDLRSGQQSRETVWTTIAEGLIEAPCSSVLTLYTAFLTSVRPDEGPSFLFSLSCAWGIFSITRASVALHFYGQSPSLKDRLVVAAFDKFPNVVPRCVLSIVV